MDFGLAFSFPFQDEEWIKKVLIAAVMVLIPIIGWLAVFGWSLEITKRVIAGDKEPLPPWTDFGGFITLGLKAWVVGLVFSIPSFILVFPASFASALIETDELATIVAIINICISCLSILYSIVIAFVLPASYGRLAATDSIGEALNIAKLWGMIRAAPSAYLIVILGYIVAGIVSMLGVIACVIGVFVTIAYSLAAEGHLYGQAYKEAAAHGAA
jgi:hypothetical protein